ncbi:MAG: hypothetical protein ACRC7O_04830 [Fimbriiglobus sp.]
MTPFAQFGLNPEKLAQFAVNLLAVGGGFLVGQIGTAAVLWFLDRKLTGGKSPPPLKKAGAALGGMAAGIVVALVVFGHGQGWVLMGGGGAGESNGPPATGIPGGSATSDVPPTTEPTTKPPVTNPQPSPSAERVRVTVLGGSDVKDERFYLLDGDPAPKRIGEVRAAVLAKKDKTAVGLELRFAEQNTLPPTHPAVLLLTGWAQSHGLTVTLPAGGP